MSTNNGRGRKIGGGDELREPFFSDAQNDDEMQPRRLQEEQDDFTSEEPRWGVTHEQLDAYDHDAEPYYDEPEEEYAELLGAEPKPKKKKGPLIAILCVVAVAAVGAGLYFFTDFFSFLTPHTATEEVIDNGTFYSGVTVLGVDLSGKTMEEAKPPVQESAQQALGGLNEVFTVGTDRFELDAQQLGASIDVDTALRAALEYGRKGDVATRTAAIASAASGAESIDAPIVFDEATISQSIASNNSKYDIAPQDATVKMDKISDEDKMIADMNISFVDEVVGRTVDVAALTQTITENVNNGNFDPVEAPLVEVQPKVTRAMLENDYAVIGEYETEYKSSAEGRRYNIWKMSDIINGVVLEPGETWSINDEAGPRTYDRGWKAAPGINSGEYQMEAGGGICQVSSTLYNAVLGAELEIVDRSHHSWPLEYVPGGLDATISTGKPDFKFKNNYDVPVYIVTKTDASDARMVRVMIYGPKHEDGLTRKFSSELIDTFGGGAPIMVPDATLPEGTQQQIIGEHMGKKYQVYKHYVDADGNEVKKEKFYVDTYAYKPAKVRVGTMPLW